MRSSVLFSTIALYVISKYIFVVYIDLGFEYGDSGWVVVVEVAEMWVSCGVLN